MAGGNEHIDRGQDGLMIGERGPSFPLDVPNRERVGQLTASLDYQSRTLFGHRLPRCVKPVGVAPQVVGPSKC